MKKEKKEKTEKPGKVEKSEFNHRMSKAGGKIDVALKKYSTIEKIAKATGEKEARVRGHINHLVTEHKQKKLAAMLEK